MNPASSSLGKMLLEEITPVVMILTTSLVEESSQKNGLDFVDMLRPFCHFDNLDVPVRTSNDQPYRIQAFKLRLFHASQIRNQTFEEAEENLKQIVNQSMPDIMSDSHENNLSSKPLSFPQWFQTFNMELMRTLAFSEHETFDHPVAYLLAVSSKEEQPVNKFVDLLNTDQLPTLLNEGMMDPKILKYYLLVHDEQDCTSEKAINILAEMRSTFGSNACRMLCLNSDKGGIIEWDDNPWAPYRGGTSHSKDIDCFLNTHDLYEIKDLMQDLASQHVIPYMEQKIRLLNQQVSITRKGFRNQIKNLWWRKGKEDASVSSNGSMYTFNSIESQMRLLGDYAFMLGDFELALSNYRLLSTDYKIDKAWKHYAGVQEMIGLSYFMLDQSRKEAEYCMENSFITYLKMGSPGQRNATRCGLWWAEMLKIRGQYKEAAVVFSRVANEEPLLHAAVMLEQAAFCYLLSDPPMLRKSGFHLVLAGNCYSDSEQREHAIRMYKDALSIYKENAWRYMNDKIYFNIGRWYAVIGEFDVAVKFMLEVLPNRHQTQATQELFLSNFVHTVQNAGKTFDVLGLMLPVINMSSIKVIFEDHRTYASSKSKILVDEGSWRTLEEDMFPSISTLKANWLDSQSSSFSKKKYKDSNVSVAGESIQVNIEFKNPLQISIFVSGISLICYSLEKSGEDDQVGNEDGCSDELKLLKSFCEGEQCSFSPFFTLSEIDFEIKGGETKVVELKVTPKVECILKIVGVKWTFADCVVGYHKLNFCVEKRKQKKAKRKIKKSSSNDMEFIVVKSIPKIEGRIQNFPKVTFTGELRQLILELSNQSNISVKNLKMKISPSRFLIPASQMDADVKHSARLGERINEEKSDMLFRLTKDSDDLLFSFPNESTIQGGTTFSWPLWFHAAVPGKLVLYISIYYEIEGISSDMNYRILRMAYDLEVHQSLDISFQITPWPPHEFLGQMNIANRTNSESFYLHQLSHIGEEWKVSPLSSYDSICSSQSVLPGEELSCFFKLENWSNSPHNHDMAVSSRNFRESSVHMVSNRIKNPVVSVCESPFIDFHRQERSHQGKVVQDAPSSMDFVLISGRQESNTELSNLFSHYVCVSIANTMPIRWIMDCPTKSIVHDFMKSTCEVRLNMTIYNWSNSIVSIKVDTSDHLSDTTHPSVQSLNNRDGWHSISLTNDATSGMQDDVSDQQSLGLPPFLWCSSSSIRATLDPRSTIEAPLHICIFSPGTYDLSNYTLNWEIESSASTVFSSVETRKALSGSCAGHPFYISVLQSQ